MHFLSLESLLFGRINSRNQFMVKRWDDFDRDVFAIEMRKEMIFFIEVECLQFSMMNVALTLEVYFSFTDKT